MSQEKIQELDKRLSITEVSLNRVLEAVERQTNCTADLTQSVTRMTASLSTHTEEIKELRGEVKEYNKIAMDNRTEIRILQNSTAWQKHAGKVILTAMVGAVLAGILVTYQ